MRKRLFILMVAAGLLWTSAPAWAHHGFTAEFDGNKYVTLHGTVSKMEWINPHAWIHVDVKDADGKVTSWMVECGSPNTLFRHGMTKTSVPAGLEVVVNGYQAKDGSTKMSGRDVTLPDGKKLFLGSSNPLDKDPKDQ
jgi:hypothetical protein